MIEAGGCSKSLLYKICIEVIVVVGIPGYDMRLIRAAVQLCGQ